MKKKFGPCSFPHTSMWKHIKEIMADPDLREVKVVGLQINHRPRCRFPIQLEVLFPDVQHKLWAVCIQKAWSNKRSYRKKYWQYEACIEFLTWMSDMYCSLWKYRKTQVSESWVLIKIAPFTGLSTQSAGSLEWPAPCWCNIKMLCDKPMIKVYWLPLPHEQSLYTSANSAANRLFACLGILQMTSSSPLIWEVSRVGRRLMQLLVGSQRKGPSTFPMRRSEI